MKNKLSKSLVALGLLLTGVLVVNLRPNVEAAYGASCGIFQQFCSGSPLPPGAGGGSGYHQTPDGFSPMSIEIDLYE